MFQSEKFFRPRWPLSWLMLSFILTWALLNVCRCIWLYRNQSNPTWFKNQLFDAWGHSGVKSPAAFVQILGVMNKSVTMLQCHMRKNPAVHFRVQRWTALFHPIKIFCHAGAEWLQLHYYDFGSEINTLAICGHLPSCDLYIKSLQQVIEEQPLFK